MELFPWCLYQWIHCQYLQQTEIYFDHQCNESVFNKSLVLHWRQNSCPGTTLLFLVFSCWAIGRVITCSSVTLAWCFINTAQNLLSSSHKHFQMPVHNVAYGPFLSPSHLKVLLFTKASLSKSSKFFILQFTVKRCKLHLAFKNLSKSHTLGVFLTLSVYYKCSYKTMVSFSQRV